MDERERLECGLRREAGMRGMDGAEALGIYVAVLSKLIARQSNPANRDRIVSMIVTMLPDAVAFECWNTGTLALHENQKGQLQ